METENSSRVEERGKIGRGYEKEKEKEKEEHHDQDDKHEEDLWDEEEEKMDPMSKDVAAESKSKLEKETKRNYRKRRFSTTSRGDDDDAHRPAAIMGKEQGCLFKEVKRDTTDVEFEFDDGEGWVLRSCLNRARTVSAAAQGGASSSPLLKLVASSRASCDPADQLPSTSAIGAIGVGAEIFNQVDKFDAPSRRREELLAKETALREKLFTEPLPEPPIEGDDDDDGYYCHCSICTGPRLPRPPRTRIEPFLKNEMESRVYFPGHLLGLGRVRMRNPPKM